MRCLNCFATCSDREVEVNDGCCPYCGAAEFEEDFDEIEEQSREDEFGSFDDEEEDELKGYDFSDIELEDDDDFFDDDGFGDDIEFEDDDRAEEDDE